MSVFRRILMIFTLAILALLVVMSIVSAFMGATDGREMFNSFPARLLWFTLLVFLLAGIVAWRRMIRSPGMLMMHVGCVAVIFGGIWGSDFMHSVRGNIGGKYLPTKGYLQLEEHKPTRVLLGAAGNPIANLDFQVQAEKLWVEYYPHNTSRWEFYVVFYDDNDSLGESYCLDDRDQSDQLLSETGIAVHISDYLTDESIPTPSIVICSKEPARIYPLDIPVGEVKDRPFEFIRTYENYRQVKNEAGEMIAIDALGIGRNAVAEIEIDGERDLILTPKLELEMVQMGASLRDGKMWVYFPPAPKRHGKIAPPLVICTSTRDQEAATDILLPDEFDSEQRRPLDVLYEDAQAYAAAGAPELVMRREQQVKDYFADITIRNLDGEVITRKLIEVNDPLRYGGYHIYMNDFEASAKPYVIVQVRSDAGWLLVWAGFVLVMLGTIVQLWLMPILTAARKKSCR